MKHFIVIVLSVIGMKASAQVVMNIIQNNGTVLQIPVNSIDSIAYATSSVVPPVLNTLPVTSITATDAYSGGEVTNEGGASVTQRGVCWSNNPIPTTTDNLTNDGSGPGSYSSFITGLANGGTYYVRAYAVNSAGVAYGNQVQFIATDGSPPLFTSGPGVSDVEGNQYPSIIMSNGQEWMAVNLRTSTYANGDPIPNQPNSSTWTNNSSVGAWAYFDNNSFYEQPYGKLYNWYAVSDVRNVCPTGWHVPSDSEWTEFTDFLGGELVAGAKLRSTDSQYWNDASSATNTSGFSGQPGGLRESDGDFVGMSTEAFWWTATANGSSTAWYRQVDQSSISVYRGGNESRRYGRSIRCLRD
ncbi:MAG: fibrobacter succinogenes major paralogous domain-containing protein [Flavobacteriales bacterium]|nr:fibrobacter succinogenes major paralogous domain-containing protein [Flavobacteriales bacterium]